MTLLDQVPGAAWLLLCGLLVVLWWWSATRGSRRSRWRNRRAQGAESEAERLLEQEGYRLLERQVAGSFMMEIDGRPVQVSCRADLLVERGGLVYVADVKSGRSAPDPTFPATRRQLLEYLIAYDVDGVLLVDMEARRVHAVSFPAIALDEA